MLGTAFDLISPSIDGTSNIYFHINQKTRCTHAYIISNDCAKKMIKGFDNINLPIDFKMNEVIQLEDIEVFWYEPGLKQIEF
jgi:GR25 family glycosyltransferase involved in LPS biosynthesis